MFNPLAYPLAVLTLLITGCGTEPGISFDSAGVAASPKFTGGGFPGGGGPGGPGGGPGGGGGYDGDGDGFSNTDGDCDDGDAAVHPDAEEVCDGVDNDCDGLLDALDPDISDAQTWFIDYDGDGIGVDDLRYTRLECDDPADGWSLDAGDCDDSGCSDAECSLVIDVSDDADLAYFGTEHNTFINMGSSIPGDHNGDGVDDLIIGAHGVSPGGAAYVIDGGGALGSYTLQDDADIIWSAEGEDEYAGVSVGWAGDQNGDGYDDALVGAGKNNRGGDDAGAIYLMNGPLTESGSLGDVADTIVLGASSADFLGRNITGVGDVNGDDFDDFMVSALLHDGDGDYAGEVYLFHGPAPAGEVIVTTADAIFQGIEGWDWAGDGLAPAGDHNGDGLADVMVGSLGAGVDNVGEVYILDGTSTGTSSLADASATLSGDEWEDFTGLNIDGGEDIDDDGYDDVLIGTLSGDGVYVALGPITTDMDLATDAFALGAGVEAGVSGAFAGDINDDGYQDVVIGQDTDGDYAYLYYGPITGGLSIDDADVKFEHFNSDRDWWAKVGAAGDMNGDGIDDLYLMNYRDNTYETNGGGAFVLFGASGGW